MVDVLTTSIIIDSIFSFNPIQEWGGGGGDSFSPVTSKNVAISPQNVLTFSFNPFATL